MKKIFLYTALSAFCCYSAFAQAYLDSVQKLDEVVITNKLLSDFSAGQKRLRLNDSVLQQNPANLTDLLSFNTSIHFNQNGYGMVASPSFRGTTAQQTAVVWNGININSQLNGQADFNTLLNPTMENIVIKPGGGSVVYGTSAIGGSIHLDSKMKYNAEAQHFFQTNYGSFNTLDTRYKWKQSFKNFSLVLGYQHHSSDNDFPVSNSNKSNINGEFNTNSLGIDAAYRLNKKHQIKFYSWWLFSQRNLSVIRPSETKSAYENQDLRSLLEWEYQHQFWRSTTKIGYLNETFEYTQNINRPEQSNANSAETFLTRYTLQYEKQNWIFSSLIDANLAHATGDNIAENSRDVLAIALLVKRKWTKDWLIEASIRQETSNWYSSPLLYNLGTDYRFSETYLTKIQISKNFRIPTFNDLFWGGTTNLNLMPETAYQVEWGHHFQLNSFRFSATGFYNYINDMIRWIPNENAIWQPENLDKARTYGVEIEADFGKKFEQHNVDFNLNYAYTVSENRETGFQLRYVPYHKFTSSIAYTFQNISVDTQFIYVGEMFTRTNNNPNSMLNDYALNHFGLRYRFTVQSKPISFGVRIFNLWDTDFQGVENRPMPGRYYQFQFSLIL